MATFWLEYEQNGNLQKFPFDAQSISIGRDKSSDFVLDHPTVSRQHAIITHDGRGNFRLVALSRGGLTAIERVPIQGEVELYDGAVLHLGQLWFRFRSEYAVKRGPAQTGSGQGVGGMGQGGYGGMGNAPGQGTGGFGGMGGAPGQGTGGFGGMGGAPGQGTGGFGGMGGAPGQGSGGFGNAAGQGSGGFGNAAGQGSGGFGGMGGAPGQGSGDFGSLGGSPGQGSGDFGSMGGSSDPGYGSFGSAPGGPVNMPDKPANDAGIVSWDEIAQSKEATQDDDYVHQETDYDRIKAAGTKEEQTNPLLVVVGIILVVGMVGWMVFGDDGKKATGDKVEFNVTEMEPVDVKVSCIGETDCMRQARASYERGKDLIEKVGVENRNLFDGYVRMLEARKLLEEAKYQGIPADMSELESIENMARQALDQKFREFRVQFHQGQTKKDAREMVRVLNTIYVFFPDMTARENRWAKNKETEMKRRGTYPRSR